LDELIAAYPPDQIILLGDLFTALSIVNGKCFIPGAIIMQPSKKILVRGNHDILPEQVYKNSGLEIVDCLKIHPFVFTHEKVVLEDSHFCNMSGHIHPGISMTGKGRQTVKLPCFLFSERYVLLPAFGQFTGLAKIRHSKEENIFVIAENKVIHVT